MKTIELEDMATVFASDFIRHCRKSMGKDWESKFVKMPYMRRKKVVTRALDDTPFNFK